MSSSLVSITFDCRFELNLWYLFDAFDDTSILFWSSRVFVLAKLGTLKHKSTIVSTMSGKRNRSRKCIVKIVFCSFLCLFWCSFWSISSIMLFLFSMTFFLFIKNPFKTLSNFLLNWFRGVLQCVHHVTHTHTHTAHHQISECVCTILYYYSVNTFNSKSETG